jgi:hypothetical protein
METPPRLFKTHGALEALQRGSPAYKERLFKRAFARVEKSRAAILSKARGTGQGGAREEVRHILDDEAEAMELEQDERELWRGEGEDTSYSDIPEHVYLEYEEFLYSLCEQLEQDVEAERYEEFERFEDAAFEDAIRMAEAAMGAMDLSE